MNFNRTSFRKVALGALVSGVLALSFRLISYFTELDPETGFFVSGAPFCTAFNAILFLWLLFFVVFGVFGRDQNAPDPSGKKTVREADLILKTERDYADDPDENDLIETARSASIWTGALSAFSSFLPAFFLFFTAYTFRDEFLDGDAFILVYAFFAILAGAAMLVLALMNNKKKSLLAPFPALAPALFLALRLVIEYRDIMRFANKALYIGQFLFIVVQIVFFVYRAELLFGIKSYAHPKAYAWSALAAFYFGVTARLPALFAVFADRVAWDMKDMAVLLLDLSLTVFAGVKFFALLREKN